DDSSIGAGVAPQPGGSLLDRSIDDRTGAVIERVCQHRRRLDLLESVSLERQGAEEWRNAGERMDGRTDVVNKTGQRQLSRSHAAANDRLGLEDDDLAAGLGYHNRGGQAVRAR